MNSVKEAHISDKKGKSCPHCPGFLVAAVGEWNIILCLLCFLGIDLSFPNL